MNNLSHYASAHNSPLSPPEHSESGAAPDGYVSDGMVQTSNNARERKKGVPWTEDEHRLFLIGLQKLGKGDWRGISRNFVQTRTPTQVASHAQKYFIRQSNMNKRKRRSSLFDIVSESGVSSIAEDSVSPSVPELATTPIHQLSLGRMYPMFYEASQLQGYGLPGRPFSVPSQMSPPMALPLMSVGNAGPGTPDQVTEVAGLGCNRESLSRSGSRKSIPIPVPGPSGPSLSLGGSLGASQVPYSFNSWPGVTHTGFNMPVSLSPQTSNVVRPTAKVAIAAPSVVKTEGEEDMKDIAQLSLGLSPPEPSQLTLKLLDQPSRHSSAFHVSTSFDTNSLQQGVNAISVV